MCGCWCTASCCSRRAAIDTSDSKRPGQQRWGSLAWKRTFARYLLVGVLNTAFAYGVYAAALLAGASVLIASLIAFVAGLVFGFKSQGRLVFQDTRNSLFVRYVLVWLLLYSCNLGAISLFMALGQNAFVAGALALPFNVVLGYVLQRYVVFIKPQA